jgi:carbohydrate-selective porin OprB
LQIAVARNPILRWAANSQYNRGTMHLGALQTNPTAGVQRNETALESTYGFRFLGAALILQADLQYIIRPGGTGRIPDAFVGGFRAGINF